MVSLGLTTHQEQKCCHSITPLSRCFSEEVVWAPHLCNEISPLLGHPQVIVGSLITQHVFLGCQFKRRRQPEFHFVWSRYYP